LRGGECCYVCGISLSSGDAAVCYRDRRFWDQSFCYHAGCWADAGLHQESMGPEALVRGLAVELAAVPCLVCHKTIESGELIRREWVREGKGVRIVHARCSPPGNAAG